MVAKKTGYVPGCVFSPGGGRRVSFYTFPDYVDEENRMFGKDGLDTKWGVIFYGGGQSGGLKGFSNGKAFFGRTRGGRTVPFSEKELKSELGGGDVLVPGEMLRTADVNRLLHPERYSDMADPLRRSVVESCPDYVIAYDHVHDGRLLYQDGVFLMEPWVYDEYCVWLSGVLDALSRMDDAGKWLKEGFSKDIVVTVLFNVFLEGMSMFNDLKRKAIRTAVTNIPGIRKTDLKEGIAQAREVMEKLFEDVSDSVRKGMEDVSGKISDRRAHAARRKEEAANADTQ